MRSSSPRASPEKTSFNQLQALRNVKLIQHNEYPLQHLAREKVRRRAREEEDEDDDDEGALCFCTFPDAVERQDEDTRRCDDVSCLNFATYVECSPSCAAGGFCRNQRLQHPECYPELEPFKTECKGYGVRTMQTIAYRDIVGEYVGEIIDEKELARRLKSVPRHELNFYYLLLAPGVYIDARNKGSFTRFVNHSCEPNCKTEKWTVKGETRIAVIALRDITVGEELTFDYQWKALGSRQIKCFCGATTCKGVIGTQNDALQNIESQTGYFRDPERQEIGFALVGRRVRVFLSPEDKTEHDVQLIKAYDEEQDWYEVENLLKPAGFDTNKNEEELSNATEKQYVKLKENGWQIFCPPGDEAGETVFAIPKRRFVLTSSEMASAAGSRDPSPKQETMSQSPVRTPSPMVTTKLESQISTSKKNMYGELLDRDGKVVSNKLLVKFLPKEYDARALRSLFVSRKHPNGLVDADVFNFLDGTGWALVELESNDLASSFRRTLDRRNLLDKMLRVYQAGTKELESFRHQKSKVQMMMRHQEVTDKTNTSPSVENIGVSEVKRVGPYCFGRKLNWLVTEDEVKSLAVQQVLSAPVEEMLRVKYVKSIFYIAKGLRLDREDATSAIIALNRYFTFHTMPMEVDIYAAAMLHLFLKAHARKVPWTAFVKEVYKAKHGSFAVECLTAASPELGVLKRRLVKAEGDLLEGLHYDVTGDDPYALLDLFTTRKGSKKLQALFQRCNGHQVAPMFDLLPPPEVQKEAKHLVAEALPLPIWTHNPVECVMLSVLYVSAAAIEVLGCTSSSSIVKVPAFLPQLDMQFNAVEARMLLNCCISICTQLKDRWVRLQKQSQTAQQKEPKNADLSEFDLEQFAAPREKKDVEISERMARLLKQWIDVPTLSSLSNDFSALNTLPMLSAASSLATSAFLMTAGKKSSAMTPSLSGEKDYVTPKTIRRSVPVSSWTTSRNEDDIGIISALSIFPKKVAAGTNDTRVEGIRLHTDEIIRVESIRKRAFLGTISSDVSLDLAGQPVYLQSWPYLEQQTFYTEERGINEACLRELSAATTFSSLLPDRFMELYGVIFPADRKVQQTNESGATRTDIDDVDLLAATIDDDGNPLPEGVDRLAPEKHYLAFEQPLHMFSGIFEAHVSLTPELRKKAIFDMLQSLSAIHDQGYVHRFVAPSHLLVFKNGIKLGGFHAMRKIANIKSKNGEGSTIAAYEMNDSERKEHCYGAWLYVTAPEVLLGETKYTWRSDIWSAGCVALAILLEKMPFLQGQDVKVQLDLIYRLCGTPGSSWEGAHKLPLYNTFRPKHEYKMRLRKTLLEQRSRFPNFPEDAVEVLEAMLQLDPARRSTVKRLLDMSYFDSIRSSEQVFDFSGLTPTFPVQKKKLMQHLLKPKPKKHQSASSSSRSSASARSSHHHHSSHRHSSSEHHRHKRSISSAFNVSANRDNSSHHDRHKTKSEKRKLRSLSTSRRELQHEAVTVGVGDVAMHESSEHVPLPASFTASTGSRRPMVDGGSLPPREKRAKLGWGMGLNSAS